MFAKCTFIVLKVDPLKFMWFSLGEEIRIVQGIIWRGGWIIKLESVLKLK